MSNSIVYKHYLRALSRWPKDKIRPESQFQAILRQRIDAQFLPAAGDQAANPTPGRAVDEKREADQVNALYSLLENRYSRKYALSDHLMKPASKPTHFADLLRELDSVQQRSWLQSKIENWKSYLRM